MVVEATATRAAGCPDADGLMEMACRRTGLSDFGDPARDAGLKVFTAALREELWSRLSEDVRGQAVEYAVHMLAIRLRLVEDRKRNRAIAQQRIARPFIVVGPPRSGSTLLHTLLSLDPEARAPEHWICHEPSPPLALGAPTRERLERAERWTMAPLERIPDIFVTHPYVIEEGSGALAECGSEILNKVFSSQQLWCWYRTQHFREYLLEADHTAAVAFHHDFLQHIQWGAGGRHWALKGSDHLLRLEEVAARYPDAMLVWTHRDLAEQLGSLANIVTGGLRYSHDEVREPYFQTLPGVPGVITFQPDYKSDRLSPRAVVRYKPTEDSSVYASFTKVYKSAIPTFGRHLGTST